MQTKPVTPSDLSRSVIAVPPLARNEDLTINREENRKLIRHIEQGGVSSLLYGGNANLYHVALSEYEELLHVIATESAEETLVVPAVGPAFGMMMDQARVLQGFEFPTAMVLPMQGLTTDAGVANGFRRFVAAFGKPAVLYIKFENFIRPETVGRLFEDGLISWIKYAVVREDPAEDEYLKRLVEVVDPAVVVSGIGEQPAIVHWEQFGLAGFTSGCVCVAPALSQRMLVALQANDLNQAESIRRLFQPLEDLRNRINPVRVLHDAVALAEIAETGPALPLLSNLDQAESALVQPAARSLRDFG